MLNSDYRKLCPVMLPYAGRQKYMHSFDIANPIMAIGYEDYLEIVKSLCAAAEIKRGIAHMTVDEKIVKAGMSQRRPKPHVDGCFVPAVNRWGNGGWLHTCNNISLKVHKRMPVIIVSSAVGARAWRGQFDTEPKNDGDLSHLKLDAGEVLPANVGYLLSADCVHESMIQPKTIQRTFLRIALPTDFEFKVK